MFHLRGAYLRYVQACITLLAVPGVDVKVDNHERTSVLHYLVRQRPQQEDSDLYVSVLREVADKGIDINTRNKHGEAPLHSACMKVVSEVGRLVKSMYASDSLVRRATRLRLSSC